LLNYPPDLELHLPTTTIVLNATSPAQFLNRARRNAE
jgi:hypothetical protein